MVRGILAQKMQYFPGLHELSLLCRYANFYTDEPMSECLGITDSGRNATLDGWAVAALRQNMSIVATDSEGGHLLGEL